MNTRQDSKNPMVYQELKHLRAQNEDLRKRLANIPLNKEPKANEPAGPIVEHRIGPEVLVALRELLVANENYFNEVKGETSPKPSAAILAAMKTAAKMVRKDKKSNGQG